MQGLSIQQAPTIETDRLILRIPQAVDFERFAEMMADEPAARHIGGVTPRAAAWRRFLQMPGAWILQGFAMFSVIDKHSGLWLGQAGPWKPEGWPGTEIGWSFHPDSWGKGYALEAGRATVEFAFQTLGWSEVIHSIDPDNAASIRLAERLGSQRRGPGKLPEPFADVRVDIWAQLRDQWLASQAAGE
jgi:RimJ/RimL family protein N-acetyltransferase